jgi:pilus assembly protein CpaB
MVSKRRVFAGVICVVVALACILFGYFDMQRQITAARNEAVDKYGSEQIEVLVVRHDLTVGERITGSDLETRIWVSALLPDDALSDTAEVIGKAVAIPLFAGEPVLAGKLGDSSSSIKVPDDRCAITVPVTTIKALGGELQPGSRVDVYLTLKSAPRLLDTDILILSTSNGASSVTSTSSSLFSSAANTSAISWVTLAVKPALVQETVAAAEANALFLVLPGAKVVRTTSFSDVIFPSAVMTGGAEYGQVC